jgi:hypothetical protein
MLPLAAALLLASSTNQVTSTLDTKVVARLEAELRLPRIAEPLDHYARFYTSIRGGSVDDLPLSTIKDGVPIRPGEPLVVAIFALPKAWPGLMPGPHIVDLKRFPQFFDGGCWAVNVVYDPVRNVFVGVWCNYDNRSRPPPPGRR